MGRRYLFLAWLAACGGGTANPDARVGGPDAPRPADAMPRADARPADAAPADAAAIDGAPADAAPADAAPDAPPSCVVPPFTTGVSTVAGCNLPGAVDGARAVARFHNPVNVIVAADETIYVADFDNDRIRRVTPTGDVTTLTLQAGFERPFGLAFGASGQLYVQTDRNPQGQHSATTGTIWRVDLATGVATSVIQDIGRPRGIARLGDGRLAVADYVHHVVRIVDPTVPSIAELAGSYDMPGFADATGPAARFNRPFDVVVLPDGSLAVSDYEGHRIRRVQLDGTVTTLAGTGVPGNANGPAGSATFSFPQALAIDATGALYIADTNNFVVRRLATGTVSTVVGSGVAGYHDDDDLLAAQLFGLEGLDLAPGGRLYIADGSRGEDINPHHRVRVAELP